MYHYYLMYAVLLIVSNELCCIKSNLYASNITKYKEHLVENGIAMKNSCDLLLIRIC